MPLPDSDLRPFLWDVRSNTATPLPIPDTGAPYHHELTYNRRSGTLLVMQQRPVTKNKAGGMPIYYDDILEYDLQYERPSEPP